MSLYSHYSTLLDGVLDTLVAEGALPAALNRKPVAVEPPRDPAHGDLATNAAMVLAKGAGSNPRALAALIAPRLEALPGVTAVEIAGPGFINLRLDEGDHTHLAFGTPHARGLRPQMVLKEEGGQTQWRIIYAPTR